MQQNMFYPYNEKRIKPTAENLLYWHQKGGDWPWTGVKHDKKFESQSGFEQAWEKCNDGNYLLWIMDKLGVELTTVQYSKLHDEFIDYPSIHSDSEFYKQECKKIKQASKEEIKNLKSLPETIESRYVNRIRILLISRGSAQETETKSKETFKKGAEAIRRIVAFSQIKKYIKELPA